MIITVLLGRVLNLVTLVVCLALPQNAVLTCDWNGVILVMGLLLLGAFLPVVLTVVLLLGAIGWNIAPYFRAPVWPYSVSVPGLALTGYASILMPFGAVYVGPVLICLLWNDAILHMVGMLRLPRPCAVLITTYSLFCPGLGHVGRLGLLLVGLGWLLLGALGPSGLTKLVVLLSVRPWTCLVACLVIGLSELAPWMALLLLT